MEQLLDGEPQEIVELYERLADVVHRCGEVVVAPTKTRVLFKVRTVFASVAVGKNWLDVVFVLGRRLKHRFQHRTDRWSLHAELGLNGRGHR